MRGEGSAARRREALVEHRLAPLTFDARGGLRLRQEPPDDATHDGPQRGDRGRRRRHRLSGGRRSRGRRLGRRLLAGDLDRASEGAGDVDQAPPRPPAPRPIRTARRPRWRPARTAISVARAAIARAARGRGTSRSPPRRRGGRRSRRSAAQRSSSVQRVVVQVVRFDGRREPRADRDDIGPIAGAGCPGRVEDHAQRPGTGGGASAADATNVSRVRRSSTAGEASRAGSDWLGGSLYRTRMPSRGMPA